MKKATALAMILAPLLFIASAIASPPLESDDGDQVAMIALHPDRWYWYALLTLLGSMLIVAALSGLVSRTRDRAPRLAYVGGALAQLGALVAIGDSTTELLVWQMGAPGADHAQMAALLSRYDAAPGAALVFTIGGLAIIVGTVLLTIGLVRTRSAPAWAAALVPISTVANIVAFGSASRDLLIVSYVLMLAGFAGIAAQDIRLPMGATRRPSAGQVHQA